MSGLIELAHQRQAIEGPIVNRTPAVRVVDFGGEREAYTFQDLRRQLRTCGASQDLLSTLFARDGAWQYRDESSLNLYEMRRDPLQQHVRSVMQPVYEAVTLLLENPNTPERGHNRHGEEHAESVRRGMEYYVSNADLKLFGIKKSERQPLLVDSDIAALVHDGGYLFTPQNHPLGSVVLMDAVFPQLRADAQRHRRIRRAVFYHEGDTFRDLVDSRGADSYHDVISLLRQESPLVAAIRQADKEDVRRSRVSDKPVLNAMDDPHVMVNVLLETLYARYRQRKGSHDLPLTIHEWNIGFLQGMTDDEMVRIGFLAEPRSSSNGFKVRPSEQMRRQYKEQKQRYFDTAHDNFLEIYPTRPIVVACSALALRNDVTATEVVFGDYFDPANPEDKFYHHTFRRESLDADVERYWQNVPEVAQQAFAKHRLKL